MDMLLFVEGFWNHSTVKPEFKYHQPLNKCF